MYLPWNKKAPDRAQKYICSRPDHAAELSSKQLFIFAGIQELPTKPQSIPNLIFYSNKYAVVVKKPFYFPCSCFSLTPQLIPVIHTPVFSTL